MKLDTTRKRPGRPKTNFDPKMGEQFGMMHLTQEKIAYIMGVSPSTVVREFARKNSPFVMAYNFGKAQIEKNLRAKLLERALKEDRDGLLVFALKNFCGMSDKLDTEHTGELTVNLTMGGKSIKEPEWLKN